MRLLTSLALLVVLSHCSGNKVVPPHELPLEQISVSKGHFVFAESKLPFVPQGANWVRLSEADGRGKKKQKNISFDTEYFSANRAKIAASLNEMALLGFNVVRVRVDAAGDRGLHQELDRLHPHGQRTRNLRRHQQSVAPEELL